MLNLQSKHSKVHICKLITDVYWIKIQNVFFLHLTMKQIYLRPNLFQIYDFEVMFMFLAKVYSMIVVEGEKKGNYFENICVSF